jgi:hypothetical protein
MVFLLFTTPGAVAGEPDMACCFCTTNRSCCFNNACCLKPLLQVLRLVSHFIWHGLLVQLAAAVLRYTVVWCGVPARVEQCCCCF